MVKNPLIKSAFLMPSLVTVDVFSSNANRAFPNNRIRLHSSPKSLIAQTGQKSQKLRAGLTFSLCAIASFIKKSFIFFQLLH